jgi:hypothetical protein
MALHRSGETAPLVPLAPLAAASEPILALSFSAASATAEPTHMVVDEPKVPPVSGRLVSPRRSAMRSAEITRTSWADSRNR